MGIIIAKEGVNYSPIKPLLTLRENNGKNSPFAKHYLAEALQEKYNELIKRDKKSWDEMISVGQLIALFIEGKQILDFNPFTYAYTPRKLKRTDPNKIKAVNFMQYYCTNWQAKWDSSNPDILLQPLSNADQVISKARAANRVVDYLENKWYNSWYNQHEGLMAQVFGWYGNRVRPDYSNKTAFSIRQIMEEKEVPFGEGFGKCYDCEISGKGTAFMQAETPTCPECGSEAVYHEPPVSQLMSQPVGQEKVPIPDIICEQLPFPAVRFDLRRRAEESSWFIYEQEANKGVIRRMLGDLDLPEGESPNKLGLDVVQALASTGAPIGGRSDVGYNDKEHSKNVITEMYLSADECAEIVIKGYGQQGEMTVENEVLPIGLRLSDMFPDGCCAVGLNGMKVILGLFAESHKDSVTSGVYHMKPLSGSGRGVADAVEIQKRFNRLDSQAVRWMQTRATPATLHVEGAISPDKRKLLGQPDVDIPVKLQNFPEIRDVRQLVAPLQGESIPGDMLNYTYQHLSSFMQLAYHITDFANGLNPRIKNDTATGAEILDANAEAIFAPALSIKADVRLNTAKKGFLMWCKYNPDKQFLPFTQSQRKTNSKGIEVSGQDVAGEYQWTVAPGSEYPKNKLTKRKDAMAFYQMFGGIMGYVQTKGQAPQEVAEAERVWDMDFASGDYDSIGEVCRARYEQGKMMLEQSAALRQQASQQFGVPPEALPPTDFIGILMQVQPSMVITEPSQMEKALWFSNLLDTDEGIQMPPDERELVSAFVIAHQQLAQGVALAMSAQASEVQATGSEPIQAQANETENAKLESERVAKESEGRVAHNREIEKSKLQHQQNLELEKVKNKAKVKK